MFMKYALIAAISIVRGVIIRSTPKKEKNQGKRRGSRA